MFAYGARTAEVICGAGYGTSSACKLDVGACLHLASAVPNGQSALFPVLGCGVQLRQQEQQVECKCCS
jgi:hypothetical protein